MQVETIIFTIMLLFLLYFTRITINKNSILVNTFFHMFNFMWMMYAILLHFDILIDIIFSLPIDKEKLETFWILLSVLLLSLVLQQSNIVFNWSIPNSSDWVVENLIRIYQILFFIIVFIGFGVHWFAYLNDVYAKYERNHGSEINLSLLKKVKFY